MLLHIACDYSVASTIFVQLPIEKFRQIPILNAKCM